MSGVSMHPGTGRGVVGTWSQTRCNIGQWLNGKTISTILVAYDHGAATGSFTGYIDDISIMEESYSVLPVKLLSFTAQQVKNDALISWQIAEEHNVQNYQVERSVDGTNFTKIKERQPAVGIKNYQVTDTNVPANSYSRLFYYRLKVVDVDGNFSYSKVQTVSFHKKVAFVTNLFPNPFVNKIDMTVNAATADYMGVVITGASGKTLINTKIKVIKGSSNVSINNLDVLSKGIYFLKLTMGEESQTFKIEK